VESWLPLRLAVRRAPYTMRSIWTLLALFSLTVVGACGNSDDAEEPAREPAQAELEAVWGEAQPIIDKEVAKEDARSAARFPCTLFDKESASSLLNAELEAPSFAYEHKNYDDSSWQAEACSWISWGDGPSLSVWVSKPEHFASGSVSCYGFRDEDVPETLLDGQAVWTFQKSFAWAKLLVCRDDALFHVEIHDGPAMESEAKEIALNIASQIAGAL